MKKQLLILLITISSIQCYSQVKFEEGYYINNSGQTIKCQIKNVDWRNNPTNFEYRLSENDDPQIATIKTVKEFGVYNISKYIRDTINMDRSSDIISKMSSDRNPILNKEELFLKVLVEGKSNLYSYVNSELKRYFYNKDNAPIEQLIYKSYKTTENAISKNNRFRQQLWNNLNCQDFNRDKVKSINYKKKDLVAFFVKYNECNNGESVNYEQKQKRDVFNLTLRPRINSSSLTIENSISNSKDTDFGNKTTFGFGVEAEFVLPFNKNKWAIILEPSYQYFTAENTADVDNVSGGKLISSIDYSSIEVPIGVRYYFFLNDQSKIFINTAFVIDLSLAEPIEFTREDGSILDVLDIKTGNNWAIGLGYKYNNRYSLELRYQTSREIFGNYLYWGSDYNSASIIFGYSLF